MALETKDLLLIFAAAPPHCDACKIPMCVSAVKPSSPYIEFQCQTCATGRRLHIVLDSDPPDPEEYVASWAKPAED